MKKTLLSALKHGSGILLTLFSLLCSCQVWADEYTIYFLRPSGEGRWGNTPRVHIYYNDGSSDHVIVNGETSDGDMSNVAAELYSKTFETDKTSIYLIFNNGGWGDNTKSATYGPWPPVSDTYFTTSNEYVQPVTTYAVRQFSAGEYIYLRNIKPAVDWSEYWIDPNTQYAYLYMWGGTAGVHTYRFNLVEGTEYAADAIYGAQIGTAGTYAKFKLTRGDASCSDGSYPESVADATGDVTFDATKNYIYTYNKDVTSVTWDVYDPCNNPTVTAGAYSSLTSSSVTIAATVTAAESDPCELSKVGVDVYTDQACTVSASVNKEVSYVGSDYSITEVNVSSLSPKVTYYYKTYAKRSSDNAKVYSSNVVSFTMPCQSGVETTDPSAAGEGPKCFGDTFTPLSVTASGASGYTYQWYYNTTNSTTEGSIAISGATSASYTPAVVGENYYYCAVGATGGYCEENSHYSGKVIINATPTLSVSESSVTNYAPVTVTAKGADIATWSVDTPANNSDRYLYKETTSSAKFKAKVTASATYTITGTTANSCSNTATVTVTTDSQDCH